MSASSPRSVLSTPGSQRPRRVRGGHQRELPSPTAATRACGNRLLIARILRLACVVRPRAVGGALDEDRDRDALGELVADLDLGRLAAQGAVNAGPSPLPPVQPGDAVEVERIVSKDGLVTLGGHMLLAAEILGGQRVGIRIEAATLMFYDLDSRELLRTRPNPLTHDQIRRLRGNRPAGPPPRPSVESIRVQRRARTPASSPSACKRSRSAGPINTRR